MPYTKAQLKNNEHYEKVIEAARREQINTFVKEERDFVASGSNAAAPKTLRMKTGEFVSIPEIENDPSQKVVIPNKTYYVTDDADKFIDKEIKELLNNNPVKTLTVGEFFQEYEKLRDVISTEGAGESHRYLIDTSKGYFSSETDEIKELKDRLNQEIDNLLKLQAELQENLQEQADDAAVDAKFAEYQAEMVRYPNTDVAYTRAEWDDKGQPVAAEGNGHPKLRFERQAMGNHKGKTDLKTDIKCTYYGRGRRKNRKLRKGNGPVIISVKALGDPTISYEWVDPGTGLPVKAAHGKKGSNFSGENTATLTVNMPGKYKNSWGPVVKCKIKDGSGETTSQAVDISRRSVNAGS
jgi:hypothetical protein